MYSDFPGFAYHSSDPRWSRVCLEYGRHRSYTQWKGNPRVKKKKTIYKKSRSFPRKHLYYQTPSIDFCIHATTLCIEHRYLCGNFNSKTDLTTWLHRDTTFLIEQMNSKVLSHSVSVMTLLSTSSNDSTEKILHNMITASLVFFMVYVLVLTGQLSISISVP